MQLKHNTLSAKYFLTSAIGIITLVFLIQGVVFLSVGLFLPVFVGVPEVLPKIFAFIGLADLVFGGVLFWYRRRQLLRHQQLMESGMVVYGELLEVEENRSIRINRRHPWKLRYRYTVQGTTYEGAINMWDRPEDCVPGCSVQLAVDQFDAAVSTLKGYAPK